MYEKLEEKARELGLEHGKAAASWYFDGNTPKDMYASVLKGILEGDPMTLDTFPCNPLSGEWADGLTPNDVLKELEVDQESIMADDLLWEYTTAWDSGVAHEIKRQCLVQLGVETI